MSVKVSYLTSSNTDNGTGFLGHTHGLARRNYDVPSEEEFLALGEKVSQCVERIDDLEQEVQDLKNSVRCCTKEVAKCQKASALAAQKILTVGKAFSNTGKLSTVFKQIVEDNLLRVQNENARMAKAVQRLGDLGVISAVDSKRVQEILLPTKLASSGSKGGQHSAKRRSENTVKSRKQGGTTSRAIKTRKVK